MMYLKLSSVHNYYELAISPGANIQETQFSKIPNAFNQE